jgi:hypothetical protein
MLQLEIGGKRERIKQGLHICQLYTEVAETLDAAGPLLRAALRAGERAWFAGPEDRVDPLLQILDRGTVDPIDARERGQLELIHDRAALLTDGRLDPYGLLSKHLSLISRSLQEGYTGVRVVIDMHWLAPQATPEQILKYEAACDAVFTLQNQPIVALVQYNYNSLPGEIVVELLKLHPVAVVNRFIKRNPYYVNADEYMTRILRAARRSRRTAPQRLAV